MDSRLTLSRYNLRRHERSSVISRPNTRTNDFDIRHCTAGILGIASQSFINSMLKGGQSLSAFLSDGKGFQGRIGIAEETREVRVGKW